METRIKKVVLYEILMEGLMKMCWLRTMEDMQLLHKHQATGKRGLEVTGPGQGMIETRAKPAVISWRGT